MKYLIFADNPDAITLRETLREGEDSAFLRNPQYFEKVDRTVDAVYVPSNYPEIFNQYQDAGKNVYYLDNFEQSNQPEIEINAPNDAENEVVKKQTRKRRPKGLR